MAENGAISITLFPPHRNADSDNDDNAAHPAVDLSTRPRAPPGSDVDRENAVMAPGGGGGASPASGSLTVARQKPRGRPPGSKNKPKPPVVIAQPDETAMRPVVLELPPGSDVLDPVSGFARHRGLGVSILSGSGVVTDVTLRHPGSASGVTFRGLFDILSLAGTFLPPTSHSSPSSSSSPAAASAVNAHFTVSLAGSHGQVVGGVIAGALVAAGPVMLLAASFASPTFQKLSPPEGDEEVGAMVVAEGSKQAMASGPLDLSSSRMEIVYGVNPVSAIKSEMPGEVPTWSSHGDRAPTGHFRHHPLNNRRHH